MRINILIVASFLSTWLSSSVVAFNMLQATRVVKKKPAPRVSAPKKTMAKPKATVKKVAKKPVVKAKSKAVKKPVAKAKPKAVKKSVTKAKPKVAKKPVVKAKPKVAKKPVIKKAPRVAAPKKTAVKPKAIVRKVAKKPQAIAKAKPTPKASGNDLMNPLTFGLKVINSPKGKEATSVLIDGGLKMVGAILDEGKNTKVIVQRGTTSIGKRRQPQVFNGIGPKEVFDASLFAGNELLGLAANVYGRLYIGDTDPKPTAKVSLSAAKVDGKTGKVLKVNENYFVNIGGKKVLVSKPKTSGFL